MKELKVAIQFYYVKGRGPPKDCHAPESQNRTFFIKIDMLIFRANLLKYWVNFYVLGLSFEVYNYFVGQLAKKLRAVKVRSVKKTSILLIKSHLFFTLWTLTARNFWASWLVEELYTSKESPKTYKLTQHLKLGATLSRKALLSFQSNYCLFR